MAGYKTWSSGEKLYATDLNSYIASQVVPRFATTAARSAALGSPVAGQLSYLIDTSKLQIYTGSAWEDLVPVGRLLPAGGTAGQVLVKDSGTDYDVSWATP